MLNGPSTKKIILYSIVTLGLYYFYWCSRSRRDIHASAKTDLIPSTWFLVIPGLNYWWFWKYAEALETVSYGRVKKTDTFLLYVLALNYPFGAYGFYGGPGDSGSSSNIDTSTLLVAILLVLAFALILVVIGITAYLCVMQRRIDTLPRT